MFCVEHVALLGAVLGVLVLECLVHELALAQRVVQCKPQHCELLGGGEVLADVLGDRFDCLRVTLVQRLLQRFVSTSCASAAPCRPTSCA